MDSLIISASTELFHRQQDTFVSGVTGLETKLPSPDATETVFGDVAEIFSDSLDLACDELRAVLIVERCAPTPCPEFARGRSSSSA